MFCQRGAASEETPIKQCRRHRSGALISAPPIDCNSFFAMMLTPASFSRAREFLLQRARPLERALFRFHFENAPAAEVRRALAAFQNEDGGFGRALEPDFRLPASSAIATSLAFRHLREAMVPARDPMVRAACGGGKPPAAAEALRSYGTHLGLAYQIVDDVVDVVGARRAGFHRQSGRRIRRAPLALSRGGRSDVFVRNHRADGRTCRPASGTTGDARPPLRDSPG